MIRFNHFNSNVPDLEKSLKFYKGALDLDPVRTREALGGPFKLVYLGDGESDFILELTWLKERTKPYNLGEYEFHLALTADDCEAAYKRHKELGITCYENPAMDIYFISNPDGYWIEIAPVR